MTAPRQTGADVRSLADSLIARATTSGGHLTSAEVAHAVEAAEVTPAQAKKLLRALADSGVTVVVDDSGNDRRRVAAARAATPASKATTAKAPAPAAPRATTAKKPTGTSSAEGSADPA
ncbi:MAG: polymerase primary sigma factor, partial [Micromonosporaceae bacterium]|nr:polymerase primary sigma factor [Micromonosporaceae bacterium]